MKSSTKTLALSIAGAVVAGLVLDYLRKQEAAKDAAAKTQTFADGNATGPAITEQQQMLAEQSIYNW